MSTDDRCGVCFALLDEQGVCTDNPTHNHPLERHVPTLDAGPEPAEMSPRVQAAKIVAEQLEAKAVAIMTFNPVEQDGKTGIDVHEIIYGVPHDTLVSAHVHCLEMILGAKIQIVTFENGQIIIPHRELVPDDLREAILGRASAPAED